MAKHRLHIVGLPHTNTTLEFSSCAYTEKVRKFCRMMHERGHEVFLYAGAKNEAPCTEHIPCMSEAARKKIVGDGHYTAAPAEGIHWTLFNATVIAEMQKRIEPHDFICLIFGTSQKQIADAFPSYITTEFGIGYGGSFAKYRVFESYAWLHATYGREQHAGNPNDLSASWFDSVIPGYLEPERFPYRGKNRRGSDYYMFIGRMIGRKGIDIAVEACRKAGKRLVVAGIGTPPLDACVQYVGEVGSEERGNLMAGAQALIAPTIYIEPFGNVAIEAMACGTPVITTDWGAFSETNVHGVTGFRCRMLREFIDALEKVKELDPQAIRRHAIQTYSLRTVGKQYEAHFNRLAALWGEGWSAA